MATIAQDFCPSVLLFCSAVWRTGPCAENTRRSVSSSSNSGGIWRTNMWQARPSSLTRWWCSRNCSPCVLNLSSVAASATVGLTAPSAATGLLGASSGAPSTSKDIARRLPCRQLMRAAQRPVAHALAARGHDRRGPASPASLDGALGQLLAQATSSGFCSAPFAPAAHH